MMVVSRFVSKCLIYNIYLGLGGAASG